MSDPFTPRRRPNWGAATSEIFFPRPAGYPEDFSPYWPYGLDFSRQADVAAGSPPPSTISDARNTAPTKAQTPEPVIGRAPDFLMQPRTGIQPQLGRAQRPEAQGEFGLGDPETPDFQRDLQSDWAEPAAPDPRLIRVSRLADAVKAGEKAYDAYSKWRSAQKAFDAGVAISENKIDDDDVASNGRMLEGGKWWQTDVMGDRRPGSEFATIVVTDDGFLLTSTNGFYLGDKVTRQPAPVVVRTQLNDQWSNPEWLVYERNRLINQRGVWGKTGEFAADVVTGGLFPGMSGVINDAAQWALDKKGGARTATYPGFTEEQSDRIRQAAIEARLAQLRHRQSR